MITDVVVIAGLIALIGVTHAGGIRDWWRHATRDRVENILRDHYHAEAEHLFPDAHTTRWPWLCSQPPCDHEDRWVCVNHAQVPCPDCTDISPCVVHDRALWAEMEKRVAQ